MINNSPSKLDDRLQRNEEPPQRQRAAVRPENPKVFLESRASTPSEALFTEQLRHRAGGADPFEAPLRPAVELIIDEYGNKLGEREVIDLLGRKSLFIVKAWTRSPSPLHKALSGVELPALPETQLPARGKRYPERQGSANPGAAAK